MVEAILLLPYSQRAISERDCTASLPEDYLCMRKSSCHLNHAHKLSHPPSRSFLGCVAFLTRILNRILATTT